MTSRSCMMHTITAALDAYDRQNRMQDALSCTVCSCAGQPEPALCPRLQHLLGDFLVAFALADAGRVI